MEIPANAKPNTKSQECFERAECAESEYIQIIVRKQHKIQSSACVCVRVCSIKKRVNKYRYFAGFLNIKNVEIVAKEKLQLGQRRATGSCVCGKTSCEKLTVT